MTREEELRKIIADAQAELNYIVKTGQKNIVSEAIEQNKLRTILKERGISAYRLAKECGIASQNIYNCLNGKQYVYPKWRKKISDYLGLPEETIFEVY